MAFELQGCEYEQTGEGADKVFLHWLVCTHLHCRVHVLAIDVISVLKVVKLNVIKVAITSVMTPAFKGLKRQRQVLNISTVFLNSCAYFLCLGECTCTSGYSLDAAGACTTVVCTDAFSCQNGGTCETHYYDGEPSCLCAPGYHGRDCSG